ncbi:MAG: VOC family protein [Acidimicrobiales bacterium]|nr:VOC family protein [Acidimicrobiales bacterium]|tara:strand:- start:86 stop:532 length:447 start_codon:yes stop_codon:yes gene_type:complete
MIIGLHHIAISVPDMERALTFYEKDLGFTREFGSTHSGDSPKADGVIGIAGTHARIEMLRAGNAFIELWEYRQPEPVSQDPEYSPANHGFAHIALQVSDIHSEYDRLMEAGMTFHAPPVQLGESAAIYGRDPFGNIVELYETSPERSL